MSARSFFRGLQRLAGGLRRSPKEALRESEERFSTAFRAGPLAIAITRVRDGHVVDANESFLELFGYARDEVNGRTTLELGLYAEPEGRAIAAAVVREQGIVRSFDIKGRTKSGEVRDLLLSASAIDLEGEPCFLSIAEDVTERKRALEALRESEERFRKVFEDGPLGMCIVTPQFVFTKVNSRLCDILGYTEDELIGRSFSEFTLPDDVPDDLMLAQAAFEAVVPVYHVEKRYIRKDGQVIQSKVTGVIIRDQAGNPLYGVGIIEDITALKEAEEALRDSEHRLRSTLDGLLEGCQIIGFDWRYLYVNDVVARQGRRTKEELLGHTMMEMYPGIDETEMFGHLRRCMEQRIPHRMQNEFTYPDGAKGWFELSIQPVPEGIFILSLDITERRRLEEALQGAREELEEKAERAVFTKNPYGLSFREFTVLHLVAAGKTDKEIAGTLGISALTASKHVANILAKMQAASRTEAGVRAVREGLIV